MLDDTIAAITTPLGEGGVGIIRVSGPEAIAVGNKIFKPKYNNQWSKGPGFRMTYGHIINPDNGDIIDEVLVSLMLKPKSFTGEDVIEINCHGGILPLRKCLEIVLKCGARIAEPGEFSKRAFLNGRLDLAQAESIIEVIRSKTDAGLKISMGQLQGHLSAVINELQHKLLGMIAHIEANIDFPEDNLEDASMVEIANNCKLLQQKINKLIAHAETGRIYKEGVRTVIVGRPNVGKSSLLNALLKEDRAIVTDIPGTTRDVIEEIINIGGIPLKIIDTAGLRETQDIVEKIGVEKTKEMINQSDLILLVIDASEGFSEEDKNIYELIENTKTLVIINKIDVTENDDFTNYIKKYIQSEIIEISALYRQGLEELETKISEMILGGQVNINDQILVTNVRHKQSLENANNYISEVIKGVEYQIPGDLISIDLKNSWEALGEITGSTVGEDLIDRIFKDFCIGK